MYGRYRLWSSLILRRGLLLLLVVPLQRYVNGLMPVWLPVAFFVLAVATDRVVAGRRWALVASVLVTPGIFVVVMTVLWIAVVLLEASGWWEEQFILAPWHLLPAALFAEMAVLWDRWAHWSRTGRTLFAPLMAIAVVAVFWSQAQFELTLFPHPSWYAVYAMVATAGLVGYQAVSPDRRVGARVRVRGRLIAGSLLIMALLIASGFAFRSWQTRAVEAGGGLLRPTAFQFDFADYVSLEPEISLSRDLVFLYRESQSPRNRLLRRYVLSGYSPRRGFYRRDPTDEPSPVPPLTVQAATSSTISSAAGERVDQEYYIVNFDPDALVAVNAPQEVNRIGSWSESSFNSAYAVSSLHPDSGPHALSDTPWPQDLPVSWREAYLQGPVPESVAGLAREITAEATGYYETIDAVQRHLLNEYSYSLSPGEAVAGNQLEHFLFESRKGYCSYFAFSMTLMLRSLGIPSRVAVGFFTNPDAAMLEFHPVRGDMAHAWVEVWFEEVGWVEFDPTSWRVAPGETVTTDYQIDQQRLSELVQEVLSREEVGTGAPSAPEDTDAAPGETRRRGMATAITVVALLVPALWWYRRRRRWDDLRHSHPRRAALHVIRRARRHGGHSLPEIEERARFARHFRYSELRRLETSLPPRVSRSLRVLPPPAVAAARRGAGGPVRPLVGLLAILFVAPGSFPVTAQTDSADELLGQAESAVEMENYDEALRRIRRGRERFPADHRFPLLQGDVFFDQSLFAGARDAYQVALEVGAPDYSTRYALSRTLARLNQDREAVNQLEELYRRYPDDLTVIGDLSWQYFKLHRLHEARALLEDALQGRPDDRDLMMTLATVYSGLWDFAAAQETYRRAINLAEHVNDRMFQAVAYYNLSILYANFHRYEQAFLAAERSLETAERSSGYMIRGELRELELSLVAAASDYRRAAILDEVSPLAELSLASLWVDAGYPRRAIARIDRITEDDSGNWMYNYGTDPTRYQRQIYTAYAEAYEALAHQRRLQRSGSPGARMVGVAEMIAARSRAWYYRGMERRQRRRIAEAYASEDRELLSRWSRMLAAGHRPRVALRHAAAAEALETEFNPAARIEYQLFVAGIQNDDETLSRLLPELQGRWRRGDRATALRNIYRIRRTGDVALQAAAEAWRLAPGELVTNGLRVPVAVATVDVPHVSRRQVIGILKRMGFREAPQSPLILEILGGDGELRYRVRDRRLFQDLRRGSVRYSGHRRDTRGAVEEIARILTRTEGAVIRGEE